MNGLLHRLAARAVGTAVAVRSDAGSRYAGSESGPGDFGEAQSDAPDAAAPGLQVPAAKVVYKPEQPTRPARPAGPTEPSPRLVTASTDAAVARDAPAMVPSVRAAPGVDLPQPLALEEPPVTISPLRAALLVPRPTLLVIEPEAGVARVAREIPATAHIALRADEPAPLMPRAARPASLAPVAPSPTRRGTLPQSPSLAQREADTEVHIHIGRIDVTAVHEAPAPRRRAATTPAPMSLDGYLTQRGRA